MKLTDILQKNIKGSRLSVRSIMIEANMPESTYYRAIKKEKITWETFSSIMSAIDRLSGGNRLEEINKLLRSGLAL